MAYLSADVAIYPGLWRWLALAAAIAFAALVHLGAAAAVGDWRRGALLATLICATFLNDAEILDVLRRGSGLQASAREVQLLVYASLWTASLIALRRSRRRFREAHAFLFWLGIVLVSLTAGRQLDAWFPPTPTPTPAASAPRARGDVPEWCTHVRGGLPDIYFLIIDSRVGADALADRWSFVDTAFTEGLRRRGFYVADSARSNYQWTVQSLAGTFGMDYLPIAPSADPERPFRYGDLVARMNAGTFAVPLRRCGYRIVNYGLYPVAEQPPTLYDNDQTAAIRFLQRTTAGAVLTWWLGFHDNPWGLRHVLGRVNQKVQLQLLTVEPAQQPVFLYAHLMMPHEPFIFAADGSKLPRSRRQPTDPEAYATSFLEQLQFSSRVILEVIDSISARGSRPHAILIQGDHGLKELGHPFSILFAARMPEGVADGWPAGVTPVNTFRVLWRKLFALNYDLLPDTSYAYLW